MLRRFTGFGGVLLALGIVSVGAPSVAVSPADYSMRTVIASKYILWAKVEKLDANAKPPRLVLKLIENIKQPGGKLPWDKMRVVMEGDAKAKKLKHPEQLFKRLALDLPVIFCAHKAGVGPNAVYVGYVYTNGTWFEVLCSKPGQQPWELTQGQPALRGTFKGSTNDLKQVIRDCLDGKIKPPAADEKEPPGFGLEVKPAGAAPKQKGDRGGSGGPVFAVIPTVAIGGPLAILAALFPSLFGKPKEIMHRYLALLTVLSVNSLLYLGQLAAQLWGNEAMRTSWWASPLTLWISMSVVTLLGTGWAWRRHRAIVAAGSREALVPRKGEVIVFVVLSIGGLAVISYALGTGRLFDPMETWRETLIAVVVLWAGTLGALYLRRGVERDPQAKPPMPLEGVMLAALMVACAAMSTAFLPRAAAVDPPVVNIVTGDDQGPPRPLARHLEDVRWTFTPQDPDEADAIIPGTIDSTPLVTADRVFVGVAHAAGPFKYGRFYALDRASGKPVWVFDNKGKMKPIFSSPCLADAKLYVGEGYHQHSDCRLFCLDAKTGTKLWDFPTKSHTESSPAVVNGKVYFGAGDDGIYCLDAATGKEVWHFEGLHVDTRLAVANGRVYGGSGGYGKPMAMICLDAGSGARIWETPSRLPVFGSPQVFGQRVFFGTGNGNLVQSAAQPAGALVCLNAATGAVLWRFDDVKDAVHTQPAVDRQHVYFGSRDKHVYCICRSDGKLRWKANLGSPVVAAPALGLCPCCGDTDGVYVVAGGGRVACLDPDNGALLWQPFEIGVHSKKTPQLLSSPVVINERDGRRHIYVGTGLDTLTDWHATLYCLEDRLAK